MADREQTREHVETILRRWGNEASLDDGRAAKLLAGDLELRGRGPAVEALVDLALGKPPPPRLGKPWHEDVNP